MSEALTLVVGGADTVAAQLRATGLFRDVVSVASTSQFRDAVKRELGQLPAERLAFCFADDMTVDTSEDLSYIVSWMASNGFRVLLFATSPRAHDLVEANPTVGLLESPFTLNQVLGAIAGFPGSPPLNPTPDGHTPLPLRGEAATSPAQAAQGWEPAPATAPAAQPDPSAQPSPPAPSPPPSGGASAQPPPAPPASGGWEPAPTSSPSPPPPPGSGQSPPPPPGSGQSPPPPPGSGQSPPPPPGSGQSPPPPVGGVGGGGWQGTSAPPPAPVGAAPTGSAQPHHAPPSQRRGYVLSFVAPKGGVGKSTLSLNSAAYLARRLAHTGKTVCLVDVDMQGSDIGRYLHWYKPDISDVARQPHLTPEVMTSLLVHREDLSLYTLLGPAYSIEADPSWINPDLYNRVLDVLQQMFDYVVIDTPVAEPYHQIFELFVLPRTSFMAVVANPNVTTLLSVDQYLDVVTKPTTQTGLESNIDEERVGVVLNRAEEGINCSIDEVRRDLHRWNWLTAVPETKEWKRANNRYEVVAVRGYPELNASFNEMLAKATGDPEFQQTAPSAGTDGGGGESVVKRLFGRKR